MVHVHMHTHWQPCGDRVTPTRDTAHRPERAPALPDGGGRRARTPRPTESEVSRMTPAGPAVSNPLWEELFMSAGPALAADPDVVTCTLIPRYEAVKDARDFTRNSLHRWGLADLFDDVALVVSELVTNALRHALHLRVEEPEHRNPQQSQSGGQEQLPIRISLVHRTPQVVCAVSDPSNTGPVARDADYIAESGRGLHLVDSFTHSWGWHPLAGAGKVVWALFDARTTSGAGADGGGGRHRRS